MSRVTKKIPRLLSARLDRLPIAYIGLVDVAGIRAGSIAIDEEDYHVDATKARGRELALPGPGVEVAVAARIADVDLRTGYLATHKVVAHAEHIARALLLPGAQITRTEIWALDPRADIAGMTFNAADISAMMTRPLDAKAWRTDERRTAGDAVVTCAAVGSPKAILVTVYNKTVELRRHPAAQAAEPAEARWKAHGWAGAAPVWRVECRLRGRLLTEYGLRDPAKVPDRIDSVWQTLISKVMRLVDRSSGTTWRDRCQLAPRREALQGTMFVHAPAGGPTPMSASRRADDGIHGGHGSSLVNAPRRAARACVRRS